MLSVFMCKRGFGRQMVYFRVLLLDQAVTTAHIFEYFLPAVAIHGGKPGKFPKISLRNLIPDFPENATCLTCRLVQNLRKMKAENSGSVICFRTRISSRHE
jgi:hypothetical protein